VVDKLDGVCAAVVRQKNPIPLQAYSSLSLSNELRRPAAYGSMLNESDRKCNKKGDKVAVRVMAAGAGSGDVAMTDSACVIAQQVLLQPLKPGRIATIDTAGR